jgi:hypothetical protein
MVSIVPLHYFRFLHLGLKPSQEYGMPHQYMAELQGCVNDMQATSRASVWWQVFTQIVVRASGVQVHCN